ncbi:MAG: hypothetical protein RL885_24375 [Planctomycetota bacterium]
MFRSPGQAILAAGLLILLGGCSGSFGSGGDSDTDGALAFATAESCMRCHNGALHDDYAGGGLENPHPFPGAGTLTCTQCHGGNPEGATPELAHVPPPPEIGDEENLERNRHAYFNRLTLTGIDKFPDYEVDGQVFTSLDYLQFINPGDLRIVTQGRSCGQCHTSHVDCVVKSPLATETGIFSGAMYAAGVQNRVVENRDLYLDTAADLAFRAITDPMYAPGEGPVGAIGRLLEFPVFAGRDDDLIEDNPEYASALLPNGQQANGQLIAGSPLANLYHEQVAFTCGNCHLGSAGANNRYGDYRSSGCTACHMRYSLDGRSRSTDPNIKKDEPLDPDDIDAPERPHVRRHRIMSVAKMLPSGEMLMGIDDYTCAGCHQGSNRTVMQYWGIRLDQNEDVRRGQQYPANPVRFETTRDDTRLFDPEVENRTFNGRNANQYLLFEDYDGDDRDDTPPDVHYEAGLGCIDCHGSHDLHGGRVGDPMGNAMVSRMNQAVAVTCESCHGSATTYAETTLATTYSGQLAEVAVDAEGNPLQHVVREADGNFYLTSRLTGKRHYVSQTRDVIVDSGKVNPFTQEPIFTTKGSYAMGRDDGDDATGIGPMQKTMASAGFSHMDDMSCSSCHASWTNNCIGCHLVGEFDRGNFSNITGEEIVFREETADFVYQSPIFFQLGVDAHDKIAPISPNTSVFFRYLDQQRLPSDVFSFSDRNGQGNDRVGAAHPSLSHNAMMPHSIRGKVDFQNEGPRYCVSCHLTKKGLSEFGESNYESYRTAMASNDFTGLDFELLREHLGRNTGNTLDSPLWVHQVAGLGTGLFLFDESGCPINPLDENANRAGCDGIPPSANYDPARTVYNLDKIVDPTGRSMGSSNHPFLEAGKTSTLRDGASQPGLSGPLGARLIQRLTDPQLGIVLDSWLDADGFNRGNAGDFVGR